MALETTLVAHGFPAPSGIDVGLASEAAVRAAGATPATIGILDGRIVIGLTASELERFTPDARKVGPRDLAVCAVQRDVGATTVGGTLAAAAAVGIRFMGTGGLGGVHRGFPTPPDVSADLGACARIPAVIASSGVKSLLDVPATMELLETLGVPVIGYRVDTLPLFYAADGGPPVSARAEDAARGRAHRRRALAAGRERDPRRPPARREPRRRRPDRGDRRRGSPHGRHRPGRDPVRARRAARAIRWRDAPGQPRPDRRERRACRRDRRRLHHTLTMALYDTVRDLPLVVEGYTLDGHEYVVSADLHPQDDGDPAHGRRRGGPRRGRHLRRRGAGGPAGARPGAPAGRRVDDRLALAPSRDAAALRERARARRVRRLPALGVRERRARPRPPPGRTIARRDASGGSRGP